MICRDCNSLLKTGFTLSPYLLNQTGLSDGIEALCPNKYYGGRSSPVEGQVRVEIVVKCDADSVFTSGKIENRKVLSSFHANFSHVKSVPALQTQQFRRPAGPSPGPVESFSSDPVERDDFVIHSSRGIAQGFLEIRFFQERIFREEVGAVWIDRNEF